MEPLRAGSGMRHTKTRRIYVIITFMTPARHLRKIYGLTQNQLAEILGVTQPAVAAWEKGTRSPKDPEVVKRLEAMEENIDVECEVVDGGLRRPPVEFPTKRWEPVVRSDAIVRLPIHLEWSHKDQRSCDLSNPQQRVFAYQQILEHGAGRDICFWIDPDALLECYKEISIAPYAKDGFVRLVERLRESA